MSNSKQQAIVHFNNGGKFYKTNLYKEALEQYQKSFEADPTFFDVHFPISKTLIKLQLIQKGIEHFKKYEGFIPLAKKTRYALGIAGVLIDEKANHEALSLLEFLNLDFDEEQVIIFITVLVANNKIVDSIDRLINLQDEDKIHSGYKSILANKNLPETSLNRLKEGNIIPRYLKAKDMVNILEAVEIKHKEYSTIITQISNGIKEIKENKHTSYIDRISKVEQGILSAQQILSQKIGNILKSKKIGLAKQLLPVLKDTEFDEKEIEIHRDNIKKLQKKKNSKYLTLGKWTSLTLGIACIVFYFAYTSIEKSKAYNRAIKIGTIEVFTDFLESYGDDAEIHRLREERLYKLALIGNTGNNINKLVKHYPRSKFLKSISVTVPDSIASTYFYGIGTQKIELNGQNSILAPIGCKVRYRIEAADKVPLTKTFVVVDDMKISEVLTDYKTLVLEENFHDNSNNWSIFSESKRVYGKDKRKGVSIIGGTLKLYNENRESNFTLSTIYLPQIGRNDDFEIVTSIQNGDSNNGVFLLFGATKRAFNYIGISERNYLFGYNNWDKSKDKWVKKSQGWQRGNSINNGDYTINTINVKKNSSAVQFSINSQYIGEMPFERWYGRRVGFGINDNTKVEVKDLKVYRVNKNPRTDFKNGNVYFCWVNELNVRTDGSTKGEIITTIKEGDPVKYLGEIGKKEVRATFKKVYSPDYYYKVELLDGTAGWVHGGALRGLITEKPLDFEKFKNLPKKITIN